MEPRIERIGTRLFIGKRMQRSLVDSQTPILWKAFMQQRHRIGNRANPNYYSIQVYNTSLNLSEFKPDTVFETWAAVEVSDINDVPDGLEAMEIPPGLYAVFIHRGTPESFSTTAQHIFGSWLPQSGYNADTRPHFQVMGEGYKRDDPDAEEEVWVPVILKSVRKESE